MLWTFIATVSSKQVYKVMNNPKNQRYGTAVQTCSLPVHSSGCLSLHCTVVALQGQQGAGEKTPLLYNITRGDTLLQQLS